MSQTLDFLEKLYGTAEEGWLTLTFKVKGSDSALRTEFFPVLNLDRIAKRAAALSQNCDVWFGIATRRAKLARGRGGASDCLAIPALWIDVDVEGPNHRTDEPLPSSIEEAVRFVNRHPIEPSILVSTGGGLHAYWCFDELIEVDDLGTILPDWNQQWQSMADDEGWHLDSTADLPRILRLPGTFNLKTDEKQEVKIL